MEDYCCCGHELECVVDHAAAGNTAMASRGTNGEAKTLYIATTGLGTELKAMGGTTTNGGVMFAAVGMPRLPSKRIEIRSWNGA